jgi:hypothetical protein
MYFLEGIQVNWIIEVCSYILATQPGGQGIVAVHKIKKKKKPAFKTAPDGRLIIAEESSGSGSEEEEYAHDLDSGKFVSVKRITTTAYSETFLMQDI